MIRLYKLKFRYVDIIDLEFLDNQSVGNTLQRFTDLTKKTTDEIHVFERIKCMSYQMNYSSCYTFFSLKPCWASEKKVIIFQILKYMTRHTLVHSLKIGAAITTGTTVRIQLNIK